MIRKIVLCIGACLAAGFFFNASSNTADPQKMPTWHVDVDASKQKAKNEYDVIIVEELNQITKDRYNMLINILLKCSRFSDGIFCPFSI